MVDRVESHYPITQDAAYAEELQRRAAELLAGDHAVLELVDAAAARKIVIRTPVSSTYRPGRVWSNSSTWPYGSTSIDRRCTSFEPTNR